MPLLLAQRADDPLPPGGQSVRCLCSIGRDYTRGAWRCIVNLDHFCLARGTIFVPCSLKLLRHRNGTFVPSEFRYGVQPSGCTEPEPHWGGWNFSVQAAQRQCRLKPELHATLQIGSEFRYGVQPSGCAEVVPGSARFQRALGVGHRERTMQGCVRSHEQAEENPWQLAKGFFGLVVQGQCRLKQGLACKNTRTFPQSIL